MNKALSFYTSLIFFILVGMVFCLRCEASLVKGPDMVRIPANPQFTFATDNTPSPIKQSYLLAKFPTTNKAYAQFCKATHHPVPSYWENGTFPQGKENHPVVRISYRDALAFCEWLSATSSPKRHYRLPTEAEWEFAASGKSKYKFPWGNDSSISIQTDGLHSSFNFNGRLATFLLKKSPQKLVHFKNTSESIALKDLLQISPQGGVRGWQDHQNGKGFVQTDLYESINRLGGDTTPVDYFKENVSPFGCHDMCGNVWEWTSSPIIAQNGAERGKEVNAIRGGSWYATARSCEVTFRGEGRRPEGTFHSVGFRVAADLPSTVK